MAPTVTPPACYTLFLVVHRPYYHSPHLHLPSSHRAALACLCPLVALCRDVVELLLQTAKKCGVEPEYRAAVASDKATALDLAKERRERIISVRTDDPNDLELKRNLDKVIEWLDKGLPDE